MGISLPHLPGVAGADEAGRGPLAGPVVCAAVILPEGFDLKGLNDSKKLTAEQREGLMRRILESADYAIEVVSREEIDQRNILWASLEGMRRAVLKLKAVPSKVLIDGNKIPPGLVIPAEAVVKGDGRFACIAAASILAKTERDRIMVDLAKLFPQYGFEKHFGYPTPEHLAAIAEHGPCSEHRRTFAPMKHLDQGSLF